MLEDRSNGLLLPGQLSWSFVIPSLRPCFLATPSPRKWLDDHPLNFVTNKKFDHGSCKDSRFLCGLSHGPSKTRPSLVDCVLSLLASRSIYKAGFRPDASQKNESGCLEVTANHPWSRNRSSGWCLPFPTPSELTSPCCCGGLHLEHFFRLQLRCMCGAHVEVEKPSGMGSKLVWVKTCFLKKMWVDEHPTYRSYFDVPQTIPRFWAI